MQLAAWLGGILGLVLTGWWAGPGPGVNSLGGGLQNASSNVLVVEQAPRNGFC